MEEFATLKLTRPYMHGPGVKRLQEFGDLLGFDYGPNDGIFGGDTENAVIAIQNHFGLEPDGICGKKTWDKILEALDYDYEGFDQEDDDALIVDIRGQHERPKLYARPRDWSDIDGVVIHQTGCAMPKDPEKWQRLNAHIGVTREGRVVLVNDYTDMIWHAQGLSQHRIGIEIAGNFPGIEGDMRTLWKGGGGPHSLTAGQMEGLETVFYMLKSEFKLNRATWKFVNVHRQSAPSRVADPGSEIYKKIVMPWMDELGATDGGPAFYTGKKKKGNPVPKEWNPSYTFGYFHRA